MRLSHGSTVPAVVPCVRPTHMAKPAPVLVFGLTVAPRAGIIRSDCSGPRSLANQSGNPSHGGLPNEKVAFTLSPHLYLFDPGFMTGFVEQRSAGLGNTEVPARAANVAHSLVKRI